MSGTPKQIAPVAWLRDAHEGQGDECFVPAAKGDPGAFPVYLSAASDAQAERVRVLEERGAFLVARLTDFQRDGDVRTIYGENAWGGHVTPALSRFRDALRGDA